MEVTYALVENSVVTNLIWLYEGNAADFPDAVPVNGLPVQIGDTYENGQFLRDGEPLRTREAELAEALEVLGVNANE